jgi:Major intrinsic protein/Phospholipase_D-nuclease N-terminal
MRTGHLSRAHINPAVTIAFTLTRHFSPRDAAACIAAQLLGATLAAHGGAYASRLRPLRARLLLCVGGSGEVSATTYDPRQRSHRRSLRWSRPSTRRDQSMSDVIVLGASSFLEAFFIALIFLPLIMVWVFALVDLFGRKDLSGSLKVLWLFAIVLLPLFGAVIYFLVRPPTAEEERAAELRVATAAGSPSEELERLINLHERGKIDDDEYARLKARIVG